MTVHPCHRIPGRIHHGPCECFRGGEAGEWPHGENGPETTSKTRGDVGTPDPPPTTAADGTEPATGGPQP